MKKILLAVALGLLSAAAQAQIWVSVPSAWVRMDGGDPAPGGGGGGGALADITDIETDCIAFLTNGTSTSANLRACTTDETGGGRAVFNNTPDLITPVITNGSTGAGYADFVEDTDNGVNYSRIKGQNAITGDFTLSIPNLTADGDLVATTFLNAWGDGIKQTFNPSATTSGANAGALAGNPTTLVAGDIWFNSTNGMLMTAVASPMLRAVPAGIFDPQYWFRVYDDYMCGAASAAAVFGNCVPSRSLGTNGGSITSPASPGITMPGAVELNTVDADGIASIATTTLSSMVMQEGFHWKSRVTLTEASTDTDTYVVYIGAHSAANNTTAAPANGLYFSYTDTVPSATPNWTINVGDTGADATADCGIAVTFDAASPYATTQTLEIYYDTATGVHFYVNAVECSNSPINTELPTAINEEFMPYSYKIARTAGAGVLPKILVIDYMLVEGPWTGR